MKDFFREAVDEPAEKKPVEAKSGKSRFAAVAYNDRPHVIAEYYDRQELIKKYGYQTYKMMVVEIKSIGEAGECLGKWVFCQYCDTVRERKPNTYELPTDEAVCKFCSLKQGEWF